MAEKNTQLYKKKNMWNLECKTSYNKQCTSDTAEIYFGH